MADVDIRDANAAPIGVPGAFKQLNTKYEFTLDFNKLYKDAGITPTLGDVFFLMNLPLGFVIKGACVDVLKASNVGGTKATNLVVGNDTTGVGTNLVVNTDTSPGSEGRYYMGSVDSPGTNIPTIPIDAERTLKVVNSVQALDGGIIKVSVIGSTLVSPLTR